MNLDNLLRIGVDAASAFVVVNIVNAFRHGWLWPRIQKWLDDSGDKPQHQRRVIALAWWTSAVVSMAFALRTGCGDWKIFLGEWISRAIICWLLSMGQFDVIKLAWPKMFDPKEDGDEVVSS